MFFCTSLKKECHSGLKLHDNELFLCDYPFKRPYRSVCVCQETVDYQEGLLAPVLQKKEEKVIQTEMGEVCVCVLLVVNLLHADQSNRNPNRANLVFMTVSKNSSREAAADGEMQRKREREERRQIVIKAV